MSDLILPGVATASPKTRAEPSQHSACWGVPMGHRAVPPVFQAGGSSGDVGGNPGALAAG